MNRICLVLAVLPAAVFAQGAPPIPEDELKPVIPPASIERTENNPAKAAIAAKEAQKKERAASENQPPTNVAPEVQRIVTSVEVALGRDTRTRALAIQVRADADGTIGLRGAVPSLQSRTAAEGVASKAAASDPCTTIWK